MSRHLMTRAEFLVLSKNRNNASYTYDEEQLNDTLSWSDIVSFNCSTHGHQKATVYSHLKSNTGCKACNRNLANKKISAKHHKFTHDEFIAKAISTWGTSAFDYSQTLYIGLKNRIDVICHKHGLVSILAKNHLFSKTGCPKCNNSIRIQSSASTQKRFSSKQELIDELSSIHADRYCYDKLTFLNGIVNANDVISCKIHGDFVQSIHNHLAGAGCYKCFSSKSSSEQDIVDYVKSITTFDVKTSDRTIVKPKELDIVIPQLKLAIEYHGLYWHSDKHKHKSYHFDKLVSAESVDYKLIQIFEDEWLTKQDIVKSRLAYLLHSSLVTRHYARKLRIIKLSAEQERQFFDNNHLQAYASSAICYGLVNSDDEILAAMSFSKRRKCLGSKKSNVFSYELLRYANKCYTSVIGGASKLLKHFAANNEQVEELISYADRRWSQGSLYDMLGFKFCGNTSINYFYIVDGQRKHRYSYRKDLLISQGFDKNKTEKQIMSDRGFNRIYDCGNKKYVLQLKKTV